MYKQSLTFESENNIISINLNQSNNGPLHSLKRKDLVYTESLESALYLQFSILLLPSTLTFKNLYTIFWANFYQIKVKNTTRKSWKNLNADEKLDQSIEKNHNPNWPYDVYKVLIIGGSGPSKTNMLQNLAEHQRADVNKIHLYVKDPFKSKYQLLINKRKRVGMKKIENFKGIYWLFTNNRRCQQRIRKDMIADMKLNKKFSPVVSELFMRGKNPIFHMFL